MNARQCPLLTSSPNGSLESPSLVARAQNCDTPVLPGTLGSALTVSAVLRSSELSVESASLVLITVVSFRLDFPLKALVTVEVDTAAQATPCLCPGSPVPVWCGLSQSRALPRPPLILRISEDLLRNTPVPQVTAVTQRHSWVLSPWPQTPFSGKTNLP